MVIKNYPHQSVMNWSQFLFVFVAVALFASTTFASFCLLVFYFKLYYLTNGIELAYITPWLYVSIRSSTFDRKQEMLDAIELYKYTQKKLN